MKDSHLTGRPRISDVAAAAGVSVSTVDRVIHGRNPVRGPTAERVLGAAEALGFREATNIRSRLRSGKRTVRLGLLLLQKHRTLYQRLARELLRAAEAVDDVRVLPQIEFAPNLSPEATAASIRHLGSRCDAVAALSANHPLISEAFDELAARDIPGFALVSQITAENTIGYVGLDNYAVGRTAGWFMSHMIRDAGKVALLVGTHRFRCQELNESGLRAFLREHAPGLEVLGPSATMEDAEMAADVTRYLLKRETDLKGIYVAGGGIDGVVQELRHHAAARKLVVIANDGMVVARQGLVEGYVKALLTQPTEQLCSTLIQKMISAVQGNRDALLPCLLEMRIQTPESIR